MDEEQIKELYCKEISKIEGDPERIKDTERFCYDKKRKKNKLNTSIWIRKYQFAACILLMIVILGGVSAYAISKSGVSLEDHFFRRVPRINNGETIATDADRSADNIVKSINDEISVGNGKVIVRDQVYDRTLGKIYISMEVYDNTNILCEDIVNVPFSPFQATMQTKDMPEVGDEVIVRKFYSETMQTEIYLVFPKVGTYSFSPNPLNGVIADEPGMIFASFEIPEELRNDPDYTFWYIVMDKEKYYEFEAELCEKKMEQEKQNEKGGDAYLTATVEKYEYRKMEPQDLSTKTVRSGSISVIIGHTDTILRYNLREDSIDSFSIQFSDGTNYIYLEDNVSTEKFVLEKELAGNDGSFGFDFRNSRLINPDDVVKVIINGKEVISE